MLSRSCRRLRCCVTAQKAERRCLATFGRAAQRCKGPRHTTNTAVLSHLRPRRRLDGLAARLQLLHRLRDLLLQRHHVARHVAHRLAGGLQHHRVHLARAGPLPHDLLQLRNQLLQRDLSRAAVAALALQRRGDRVDGAARVEQHALLRHRHLALDDRPVHRVFKLELQVLILALQVLRLLLRSQKVMAAVSRGEARAADGRRGAGRGGRSTP